MYPRALVMTTEEIVKYAVAHCGLGADEVAPFRAWLHHNNMLTLPTAAAQIIEDWVLQWDEAYLGEWHDPMEFVRWWATEIASIDGVAAALFQQVEGAELVQDLLDQGNLWIAQSEHGFYFYAR